MERVLLVTIKLESQKDAWHIEDSAAEMEELSRTTGAGIIENITCQLKKPTANLLIGSGKAEEIAGLCEERDIDTVIFSEGLSGTQQRNLEEIIGRKTIDRTQLILDIFARHAKGPEGRMQVELAQLQYLMPRLIGKGIILSRLGGGIGTSGPGEQKLEMDRRRIRKRIDRLNADLKHLGLHRQLLKKQRKENAVPVTALVGYTSAGKSTLLNTLTGAEQTVSDSLFTTLDPSSKTFKLPNGEDIILLDTVGFLHNLPHNLIEAFKATLEEVMEADLLIHVLDVSHRCVYEHAAAVTAVLKELKADNKPVITALNKVDLLDDKMWLSKLTQDFTNPIAISAKFKINLEELVKGIQDNFKDRMAEFTVFIPHSKMELLNLIYRNGKVRHIEYLPKGIEAKVTLPKIAASKLLANKEITKIY